jgi:O-antigen/teichoic acid export membrane protein
MDTSRLKRNLGLLYAGELTAKLLGMSIFAFLARRLGAAGYGEVECAVGAFFVCNLMLEAGLSDWGAREAARRPHDTPRIAAQVVYLRCFNLVLALAVLACFAFFLRPAGAARTLTIFYAAVLAPSPLVLSWVFQSRDEMAVVAVSSAVRQAILAAVVFFFVRDLDSAIALPLGDAAAVLVVVAGQHLVLGRRAGRLRLADAVPGSLAILRSGMPVALSALTWALRLFAPLLLLGAARVGDTEPGVFAAGHRLIVSAHTFAWLYFFNLLPTATRAAAAGDLSGWRRLMASSIAFVVWTAIPGAILGTFAAPTILRLINGASFAAGGTALAIMCWGLAAAFLSGHQRYSLIAFGKTKHELAANVAGAAVSIGVCLWFGATLDAERAAAAFLAAELTTLIVADALLRRTVGPLPLAQIDWRPRLAWSRSRL